MNLKCWSSLQSSFVFPVRTCLQCSFYLRCFLKVLWCPFNMIVFYTPLTTLIVFSYVDQLKSKMSWRQTSAFKRVSFKILICGKHVTTISKTLSNLHCFMIFFWCQTGSQQKSFQSRGSCSKSMLCSLYRLPLASCIGYEALPVLQIFLYLFLGLFSWL